MTRTTRQVVEAMLPSGATIDDLSEQEVAALFEAVIRRADGAGEGLSPDGGETGAAGGPGQD